MGKTILGITSHIDDNVMFAGSVMKLQDQGYKYYEIVLTDSAGSTNQQQNKPEKEIIDIRKEEMAKAAEILNIKHIYWLEQDSGNLQYSKTLMLKIVRIIRELKPEIGFAINSQDVHPDHVEAARLTKESFRWAAKSGHPELGIPHRSSTVLFAEGTLPISPSLLVDISKYYDRKEQLFKAYTSQALPKDLTLLKSFALIRGYHLRKNNSAYAEAFTVEQNILPILFEK